MGRLGLVPVSFGYKTLTKWQLDKLMEGKDVEGDEFRDDLLDGVNFLCTFGLQNELSTGVSDDVSLIKYGHKVNKKNASYSEGG